MHEVWKEIIGWPGYEVSNIGNVRSVDRCPPTRDGQILHFKGKTLKQRTQMHGYSVCRLRNGCIKTSVVRVHRLVAEAFVPNPENKPYVNHLDNNPSNNCADNLEWCTQQENIYHARKQGRMYSHPKGAPSKNRKLNNEQVSKIRALALSGKSQQKIADAIGCSKRTVQRILNGESYV